MRSFQEKKTTISHIVVVADQMNWEIIQIQLCLLFEN